MSSNKFTGGYFDGTARDLISETAVPMTAHMVFCDYIAHLITGNLKNQDDKDMGMLEIVGKMKYDLHEEGYLLSSKKTIEVTDINGCKYKITVEAV